MYFYKTLQVKNNSNQTLIKSQYKKLTIMNHPDRQGGSNTKFIEIKKAYSFLSNKFNKNFYDTFGEAGLQFLKTKKNEFLFTRCFDRVNIFLFILSIILIISSLVCFPGLVYVMKENKKSVQLIYQTQFIFIGAVLSICAVRMILLLKKNDEFDFKEFIKYISVLVFKILLLCTQLVLYFNFLIVFCYRNVFYYVPYIFFEIISFAEFYICQKSIADNEKSNFRKNFIITFAIRSSLFISISLLPISAFAAAGIGIACCCFVYNIVRRIVVSVVIGVLLMFLVLIWVFTPCYIDSAVFWSILAFLNSCLYLCMYLCFKKWRSCLPEGYEVKNLELEYLEI